MQTLQRPLEVADAKADVLQRATLPGPVGDEQGELPTPRVRADEGELVGLLDHVHREPLGQEVGDAIAIGDPERHVIEGLGPHLVQPICRGEARSRIHYFLRLTAARSCRLFIDERPLMFSRFAWL